MNLKLPIGRGRYQVEIYIVTNLVRINVFISPRYLVDNHAFGNGKVELFDLYQLTGLECWGVKD